MLIARLNTCFKTCFKTGHIVILCSLISTNAYAEVKFQDLFKRGKTFFSVSGGLGGDALEASRTTSGDVLNAGDGFNFTVGRDARYSDYSKRFIRLSASYKYSFLDADNGKATFTAIPVKALYMQQNAKAVYGAGIGVHLNPTLKVLSASGTADASLGFTAQAAYRYSPSKEVGITIDIVDYDGISGNSVGAYFTQRFGYK